jgi:uncharacterized protein YdeI (YjbR/CyaY-like superfamily)
VAIPAELAAALAADPDAGTAFERLTHRRQFASGPPMPSDTRARRVARTLERLRG